MTTRSTDGGLWTALEAYLAQRRALGFRLVEEERHARRFLEWLQDSTDVSTGFTVAQALSWAHGGGSLKNSYQCQRLNAIRGLARYCHAIGLDVQVPPANTLRTTRDRRRPHIYTQDEVDALLEACQHAFTHPLVRATMAAVIALLAVTGMRPGEAVRLRRGDIDAHGATMLIRANKHGPDRLIPLHPTTLDALAGYLASPYRRVVAAPPGGDPVRHHPGQGLPAGDRGGPLPTDPGRDRHHLGRHTPVPGRPAAHLRDPADDPRLHHGRR